MFVCVYIHSNTYPKCLLAYLGPSVCMTYAETMLQINLNVLNKMLLIGLVGDKQNPMFTLMINAMDCAFMSLSKA